MKSVFFAFILSTLFTIQANAQYDPSTFFNDLNIYLAQNQDLGEAYDHALSTVQAMDKEKKMAYLVETVQAKRDAYVATLNDFLDNILKLEFDEYDKPLQQALVLYLDADKDVILNAYLTVQATIEESDDHISKYGSALNNSLAAQQKSREDFNQEYEKFIRMHGF